MRRERVSRGADWRIRSARQADDVPVASLGRGEGLLGLPHNLHALLRQHVCLWEGCGRVQRDHQLLLRSSGKEGQNVPHGLVEVCPLLEAQAGEPRAQGWPLQAEERSPRAAAVPGSCRGINKVVQQDSAVPLLLLAAAGLHERPAALGGPLLRGRGTVSLQEGGCVGRVVAGRGGRDYHGEGRDRLQHPARRELAKALAVLRTRLRRQRGRLVAYIAHSVDHQGGVLEELQCNLRVAVHRKGDRLLAVQPSGKVSHESLVHARRGGDVQVSLPPLLLNVRRRTLADADGNGTPFSDAELSVA
mmetsp:Transcript_54978/g.172459  ORF Transcript_54978/g.172459 Transcript_54978/m.172459 type:complete len:303 (+) Transcript_54978:243-1151(+)